jgi:cell division protein FtsI/penicillin-binding protein 2
MKSILGFSELRRHRRASVMNQIFVVIIILLALRFFYFQILKHPELLQIREKQSLRIERVSALRGEILDRDGVVLTESKPAKSLYACPKEVSSKEWLSKKLEDITGISEIKILKQLNSEKQFVCIKRKIDDSLAIRLDAYGIRGLYLLTENKRYYPLHEISADVLGFVDIDNQGLSGLELCYNAVLNGRDGLRRTYYTGWGTEIPSRTVMLIPPSNGEDVHISLSKDVQKIVEEELRRYAFKYDIAGGIVIVMEPYTGEILAMADYPFFDPNSFLKYSADIYNTNGAIQELVESKPILFMIMTAGGIERKELSLKESSFGKPKLADYFSSFREIDTELLNSLSHYLGKSIKSEYLRLFGVGRKTGIDLPFESDGALSLYTLRYGGEGIFMTPIQITETMAIVANDGIATPPVLAKKQTQGAMKNEENSSKSNRVILKGTSHVLKQALLNSVNRNTREMHIEGYPIGGIGFEFLDRSGQPLAGAGFTGFKDDNDPENRFVVFTMIKIPRDSKKESDFVKVAQKLFRTITYETIRVLELKEIDNERKSSLR